MKILILILLLSCPSFGVETAAERQAASLVRGIDLMQRETALYQARLDIQIRKLRFARTDVDARNANQRIKEINIVLESLANRMIKANKELTLLKGKQ